MQHASFLKHCIVAGVAFPCPSFQISRIDLTYSVSQAGFFPASTIVTCRLWQSPDLIIVLRELLRSCFSAGDHRHAPWFAREPTMILVHECRKSCSNPTRNGGGGVLPSVQSCKHFRILFRFLVLDEEASSPNTVAMAVCQAIAIWLYTLMMALRFESSHEICFKCSTTTTCTDSTGAGDAGRTGNGANIRG